MENKIPLDDGLVVEIVGRKKFETHTPVKTFQYHLNEDCLSKPPDNSNINQSDMSKIIYADGVSVEDLEIAKNRLSSFTFICS